MKKHPGRLAAKVSGLYRSFYPGLPRNTLDSLRNVLCSESFKFLNRSSKLQDAAYVSRRITLQISPVCQTNQ